MAFEQKAGSDLAGFIIAFPAQPHRLQPRLHPRTAERSDADTVPRLSGNNSGTASRDIFVLRQVVIHMLAAEQRIRPLCGEQLLVRALLDDAPALHDDDAVVILNG